MTNKDNDDLVFDDEIETASISKSAANNDDLALGNLTPAGYERKFDELLSDQSDADFDEDSEFASAQSDPHSRKRKGLFCFHCHRREGHFLSDGNRWYFNYLLGLTFGLMRLVGPFQCQCCGQKRLMFTDYANIRYVFRDRGSKRKRSSKRKARN